MKNKIYSGIYMIKNTETNKKYIGSSKNIYKRYKKNLNDLRNNKHHNIHLQRSWNKYGKNFFKLNIIEECEPNNLIITEQLYLDNIFESDNYMNYYNISLYSNGGDNISYHPNKDIIIQKISEASRKRYNNMTIEEKNSYSKSISGENNSNYGNKWNDIQRENLSNKMKKHFKYNDNYIKNSSWEIYYGKKRADELKQNLSTIASSRNGNENPFYGKKHTEESKDKIREANLNKKVLSQLKPFTVNNVIYLSLSDASKELNIHLTTVRHRLISSNKKFEDYQYITDIDILNNLLYEYRNILS